MAVVVAARRWWNAYTHEQIEQIELLVWYRLYPLSPLQQRGAEQFGRSQIFHDISVASKCGERANDIGHDTHSAY